MNSFFRIIIVSLIVTTISSCEDNRTYYEQIKSEKAITARVNDLNKSINEIRKQEKGSLIKDGVDILKYVYYIGDNDTYIVSYLFDDKGCYEIGLKSYFGLESDTKNMVDGFRDEIKATEFGLPTNDNNLYRWLNNDKSVSVEIDYKNTSRGLVVVTIFANE